MGSIIRRTQAARSRAPINLVAVHYKLRQADLLCRQLRSSQNDIANEMARAVGGDYRLPLDTYFGACLGAAQTCFYIIVPKSNGPATHEFREVAARWKVGALDQSARTRFHAMVAMRGEDVHFGESSAEALKKMVAAHNHGSMYNQHNSVLFGPPAMAEHRNPDGEIVRASMLRSTFGLYIVVEGRRIEATTACAEFIGQLRSLLAAAEAERVGDAAPLLGAAGALSQG